MSPSKKNLWRLDFHWAFSDRALRETLFVEQPAAVLESRIRTWLARHSVTDRAIVWSMRNQWATSRGRGLEVRRSYVVVDATRIRSLDDVELDDL